MKIMYFIPSCGCLIESVWKPAYLAQLGVLSEVSRWNGGFFVVFFLPPQHQGRVTLVFERK